MFTILYVYSFTPYYCDIFFYLIMLVFLNYCLCSLFPKCVHTDLKRQCRSKMSVVSCVNDQQYKHASFCRLNFSFTCIFLLLSYF